MDENCELTSCLFNKLKSEEFLDAVEEIQNDRYKNFICHNTLEIVPVMSKWIENNPGAEYVACVEELLCYIAAVGKLKEVLLAFLEVVEILQSEVQLRVVLSSLKEVLRRLQGQNVPSSSFSWVFNTLYTHVVTLELPANYDLEGKERLLLDSDDRVQKITDSLQHLVSFYSEYYNEIVAGKLTWKNVGDSHEFMSSFLLQYLDRPLAYLDVVSIDGIARSASYSLTETLVFMVTKLLKNPFKLLKNNWLFCGEDTFKDDKIYMKNESSDENNATQTMLSLAMYFYCIISQGMCIKSLPCVYSPKYVYLTCISLVNTLLSYKEFLVIDKGLRLSHALLTKVCDFSVSKEDLEYKNHAAFPKSLFNIMTTCNNRELRSSSLKILQLYIKKFDVIGQYYSLSSLLTYNKHHGIHGILIHGVKEYIVLVLSQMQFVQKVPANWICHLLELSCSLPERERTDILEASDHIMAALNLLLFLSLRDASNILNWQSLLPSLKKDFLEPLHKGLDISKAHYELRLKEEPGEASGSIISGLYLTSLNLSKEQEIQVLKTALCSFDLIYCVLAQLEQAISVLKT